MVTLFDCYDEYEDGLIEQYRAHPAFPKLHEANNRVYVRYLLQLAQLSFEFVKWVELAKLGLENERAIEIVRHILREEIPSDRPSHKEDLLADLRAIGVSTADIRGAAPTRQTEETIKKMYQLIRYDGGRYDIRAVVALRVAGEVLVAETYHDVIGELVQRFSFNTTSSRFYYPHFVHDRKKGDGGGLETHSDAFGSVLAELLTNDADLQVAKKTAKAALDVRYGFHDQFPLFGPHMIG